jgi:hypothetical protein
MACTIRGNNGKYDSREVFVEQFEVDLNSPNLPMEGLKKHKHLIQDVRPADWNLDCRHKSITYLTAKCDVKSVYLKLH